ncbi:MAG TPA: glutamate--tRNA ligase [Tepidisphaeraceae bacterium]|jgi:glutamyl-tRNA synthetase
MANVVTRFAPSPTGYLHVGGARTALFNWLYARHTGGRYLLRIEDTDLARSTEDATRQLVEDLTWLGLNWDNEELVYQSKRLDLYNKLIDQLLSQGKAYEAWESTDELTAMREQAAKAKRPFLYRRRNYTADELKRFSDEGRTPVIRFAMPVKEYRFHDITAGREIVQSPFEVQDLVIRKTDGMPTYHFSVVVDDAAMGVTHVLRGSDHILNTVNHIALQEAFGYERPIYAHFSTMLNPETGQKLSKRDRDGRIRKRSQDLIRSKKFTAETLQQAAGIDAARFADWLADETKQLDLSEQPKVMKAVGLKESDLPEVMVHDFRKNGYAPEVLNNFLALQGWSPGGDLERMTMEQLIEKFSLDRTISANPKFNREKLKSFSTDFYSEASIERQLAAMKDYLSVNPQSPLNKADDESLKAILTMSKGYHVISEVDDKANFFFVDDDGYPFDPAATEKVLLKNEKQGLSALSDIRKVLADVSDWTAHGIEAAIKTHVESTGGNLGKIAQPIRVAITGASVSPPLFDCLALLGKERTLKRIDRCIASVR